MTLGAVNLGHWVILIGDSVLQYPVIKSNIVREQGLDKSLHLLYKNENTLKMSTTYGILDSVKYLVYNQIPPTLDNIKILDTSNENKDVKWNEVHANLAVNEYCEDAVIWIAS